MTLISTLRSLPGRVPLVLMIAIYLYGSIPLGNSQLTSNQSIAPHERDNTFRSMSDKFSITVPASWVIQDIDNTDTYTLLEEMTQGSRLLAQICPKDQAIADNEATYNCEESNERIYIEQYRDLANQPEFASLAHENATNQDILNYRIMRLQKLGYSEINILHNTNMTINVIDSDTNKTIAIVPASLVEMRYNSPNSTDTRGYFLLSSTNATSDSGMVLGYSLSYEANAATLPSIIPPEPILRIFQSFEFVKEARGELISLNMENNDYSNDTFTSTGIANRYLDVLPPPLGFHEQTYANNSRS